MNKCRGHSGQKITSTVLHHKTEFNIHEYWYSIKDGDDIIYEIENQTHLLPLLLQFQFINRSPVKGCRDGNRDGDNDADLIISIV